MFWFRRSQPRVTVAQLLSWAESQIALGVPRQTICEGWLKQDRTALTEREHEVYAQAERQVFDEMVARNMQGAELEKQGHSQEAIAQYEANVRDGFVGAQPYLRLQALYLARGDYDSALRVSRQHSALLAQFRTPPPRWSESFEEAPQPRPSLLPSFLLRLVGR